VNDINVKVDRIVHLATILGCIISCLPKSYYQPFGGQSNDLFDY
jgi:hypothetical protein